jgi:hypothetical protein
MCVKLGLHDKESCFLNYQQHVLKTSGLTTPGSNTATTHLCCKLSFLPKNEESVFQMDSRINVRQVFLMERARLCFEGIR